MVIDAPIKRIAAVSVSSVFDCILVVSVIVVANLLYQTSEKKSRRGYKIISEHRESTPREVLFCREKIFLFFPKKLCKSLDIS